MLFYFRKLSETFFGYSYMKSVLDEYRHQGEGEIEAQAHRFLFPWNKNKWLADLELTNNFLLQRDQYFRSELNNYLGFGEAHSLQISCYPNPFATEIRIRIESSHFCSDEIAIYDMTGRKVFSHNLAIERGDRVTIHPDLPAGVYVLCVAGCSQKIVKLR